MLSVNDINNIQGRIASFELAVDRTHPKYEELDSALTIFNNEQKFSILAPHTIVDTSSAIGMATMRGVITPNREYLDKFARDIKDKKVTEADIDRVVVVEAQDDVLNAAKKYTKGFINKAVDKSHTVIVDMLYTAIQTQGLPLLLLIIEYAKL